MNNKFGEQSVVIFSYYDYVAAVICCYFLSIPSSFESSVLLNIHWDQSLLCFYSILWFLLLSHKHVNMDSSFTAFISPLFKQHLDKVLHYGFLPQKKKCFILCCFRSPRHTHKMCVRKALRDWESMFQLVCVSLVSLSLCFYCVTEK